MAFEVVLPARQGGLQRRRLVATAVIVAAGLVAAVIFFALWPCVALCFHPCISFSS
jgi:cytochrome c oxidase subunit IV